MKFLTPSEAGKVLGRSRSAIRGLIKRGHFPHSKIAGRLLIDAEELEKYLKGAQRMSATQAAARYVRAPRARKEAA